MTADAIRGIVDTFKEAELDQYLVFFGGNGNFNRIYMNNSTNTTIIDYDKERLISFRTNNNPIRSSMGEMLYEIFIMDFASIDGAYVLVDAKEAEKITPTLGFDAKDVKRIILDRSGVSQAKGFTQTDIYNESGNLKAHYVAPKPDNVLPVVRVRYK